MSTLWCCPFSTSSADHGITHPPRGPDGWIQRGCHGMWHARTMQVSISWQLPEEVPVDPQGSKSCSPPSHCSFAKRRCGQVSSLTCVEHLDLFFFFFFQSEQAWSMFYSHSGGWRWLETCTTWTGLQSWWCCSARSSAIAAIAEAILMWLKLDGSCYHAKSERSCFNCKWGNL